MLCGGRFFPYWGARLCKLRNNKFVYYKPTNVNTICGVLDFNLLTCAVEVHRTTEQNVFRIRVLKSPRAFVFRAASNTDLMEWVYQIQRQIQTSDGFRTDMTAVAIQPAFWHYLRISPAAVQQTANTGDLVLFRSSGAMPWILRVLMCSTTDHIGVIIKEKSGEVYLLESRNKLVFGRDNNNLADRESRCTGG